MQSYHPLAIAKSLQPFDFHEIVGFNGASFAVFNGTDLATSDWELHPDTDELLMVLEGSVTVEILTDTESHRIPLTAGQFAIVPKGHWHRHTEVRDLVEMFFTPGETVESTAVDPRRETSAATS
ncbi:cupin domain-containing protein [Nocardia sp. CA-128927]|uniref:cupin domain-containing protein n=1 Tax=Nocardia sp. CA-128927 TaxID=3239975 RepID=UPI003D969E1A